MYIEGSQKMDFNSLKLNFVLANSGDPDEMLHYATFNLFLHSQSTHLGFFYRAA